ncbi:hypothetical protein FNF28_03549 [Cafeteria roenbergensis]|uniref:POPDC1-3 domain-containing protein n=1 Tax=Cafeteria roenbergensis TaxID=33653 RepID=A0A5A8DMD8_CAFRO|nr:hypothetical protein FNF28_03549 [Cafeteria roenbergensis]
MGPNAVQGKAKRIEQELADQAGKNKVWQVDSAPAEPSETVKRLRFVLGNLGYFCTLLGYTMEDMLWLRALMMCSGVLTIGFAALHSPPIWIPIFWCCVFFTINFMYIMRLLADRKEVEFSGLALDAYESAFQAHGFTPRQFQRLMQEGKGAFLEVFEGDALVLQGDPLRKVVFLVSGEADLVIGGRRVAAIKGGNFATSLQCLLEASDAAAAKEVAKRVAERQAEEQDEDDEEDVGHNGAGGGGGAAAAAAAAVDLGPNPSEGGAARQAGAGAANPGGSRDGSGAAPARRGKRRLRQEAWMAAAVGDETAGPDQTGTGSGAPGPEGVAPGPDTVDQHLLQPVAASLAAGRRFNRRASRRVLAEENDDWVGGDSAPKPAAAASARGAMDDDLEAGEPEKLGDLLREAGHAFVEAGQAVGVLISEAVKERFQPSDDEDDDEDDDEEDEERRGAHNRTSAHRATASVLVASPEATVIVWDLDAMRAVIEREKPMRFPAMSMVASEMASRLLLTTRSIERTYQYRKELQRRIHAGSGMLRDADRQALQAWQVANHVTREEHEEALEAVGWTPSDFQAGWSASTAKVAAAKLRQRTGQGVRASMDWFTSRISGIIHQDASSPAANVRLGTPKPDNAPPEHRA